MTTIPYSETYRVMHHPYLNGFYRSVCKSKAVNNHLDQITKMKEFRVKYFG